MKVRQYNDRKEKWQDKIIYKTLHKKLKIEEKFEERKSKNGSKIQSPKEKC